LDEVFRVCRDPSWAARVEAEWARWSERLRELLPSEAEVHHVGSTAVPGSLTKGDLDLVVRVPAASFDRCEALLAGVCARNVGSLHTASLASFVAAVAPVDVGIQLVAAGGDEDHFLAWRDRLLADPVLRGRYDALKVACVGVDMATYRERKSAFIREALGLGAE
jgi:GrpB-like predicted nucleotidyltransferase (UPF0157 family)